MTSIADTIARKLSTDPNIGGGAPLSVLGVDPEPGFAGGESQVLGLTAELRRGGHRAELLCDPRGVLWSWARERGITCHPLAIRNAVDFAAGIRLRQFLRRTRYDVVHFHTSRAHALAPFARGLANAMVVTRRMDYTPNRLFAPYLYNRAVDAVAAISEGVADSLAAAGVDRDRVAIIPSGVDSEHFRPPSASERTAARNALGLRPSDVAVGTVGALESRKGHRYLLAAISELQSAGAGSSAIQGFIAGLGSLEGTLNADLRNLRLEGSVRLLGRVDEPVRLLWALDIFAFPSLHEGLGIALLEAMACGLPVVASRTGGITDAVEDGRTGMLVAPANSSELGAAIARLAAESRTRETLGESARRRVLEKFSISAMARATLALYRVCLGRGAAATAGRT